MKTWIKALCLGVVFALSAPALAAVSIPFTVNLSEAVTVNTGGGTPRIAVDVGGVTRYATYTSGSGTTALVFTYALISGDVDLDGVTLSSPIQLNGGTMKDAAGNDATLTFTVPNTSGVLVNAAVPSGYTMAFADRTVTNVNKTALSFSLTYPKANKTLNYSIASSGGGAPITGTVTTAAVTTTVNGIDATTLSDGKLTLSAYLTDSIGGTGSTVTDIIPKAVLDASLVGHWTFDSADISGITAFDRSGQGNNGTLTNGPTQTTGQVGGTLSFDGTNDFVNVNDSVSIGLTNAFSLVLWMKTSNTAQTNRYLISKINNAATDNVYSILFGYSSQTVQYYAAGNAFGYPSINSNINVSDNNWHHIIYTYNGSSFSSYMDGSLINTYSLTSNAVISTGALRFATFNGAGFYFIGNLDDIRIYNRALTPTEVTTLYNATN